MAAQMIGAILLLSAAARSVLALCPPPLFPTVDVECTLEGRRVPCDTPQQPGARAAFRCKALHHFLFDYLPPTGYASECREDGEWSVRPFRCVPVCGQPTGRPVAFVRNGEKVGSAAEYPWHVAIYDVKKNLDQICGGSLISSKFLVSAAHCFYAKSRARAAEDFMVAVGKTRRRWGHPDDLNVQTSAMKEIHFKNYGDRKLQYTNDIALVELASEVQVNAYVLPVCVDWPLELPILHEGERGTVVGFGQNVSSPSEELRFARLPFVPSEECKKDVAENLAVFTHLPDKFCVGYVNGATVAQGDSGGGLAFQDKNRSWFLRGVVSVGSTREVTYSLFTNVTAFIPWMAGVIQKGEVSGRRCGVDVTESEIQDGVKLDQNDFPWEVEVFIKRNSNRNFTRQWSGTLVEPQLVVTGALSGSFDFTELRTSWIRVASLRTTDSEDLDKAAYISKVRRFHYPEDVLLLTGHVFTFVLLELEEPINLMPACMDWNGNALLQNQKKGTTLMKTGGNSLSWRHYNLQSSADCKVKKLSFLDNYNFCVFGKERLDTDYTALSRSIMVNVDSTWYLRGIVAADPVVDGDEFTAVYTDFADKEVQQWLSRTRDLIGKPTCGKVHLCEELHTGSSLPGHLPWNVEVIIETESISSKAAGVLIQSNVVITDSGQLVNDSESAQNGSVSTVDPSNIKIVWTASNGSSYLTNVIRLHVHQSSLLDTGKVSWDVVVLELDAHVDAMPICTDLTGLVLQPLEPGQTGVVETWKSWSSPHTLNGVSYVTQLECLKILFQTGAQQTLTARDKLCSGPVHDKVLSGASYMVFSGNYWYLRGLSAGVIQERAPYTFGFTDFRTKNLRDWLSATLKLAHPGREEKQEPPLLDCVGGHHAPNECGRYLPPRYVEGAKDFKSAGNMPWVVEVHVDEGEEVWKKRLGMLVRSDVILTGSFNLVTDTRANITGQVSTVPPSNLFVKWITADYRDQRITEVARVHVRERLHGSWQQSAWDAALLELKTPIPLMPVCLPRLALGIPALSKGDVGLSETWGADSSSAFMFNVDFLPDNECQKLLPNASANQFTADRFCGGPLQNIQLWHGAPFLVREGRAWFLRGINSFNWGGENRSDIYTFYNMSDPDIMNWIQEKMKNDLPMPTSQYSEEITTTERPTTTPAYVKPFPSIEYAPIKTTTPVPKKPPRRKPTQAPATPVKCGQFDSPQLPEATGMAAPGRMPWAVAVVKEGTNSRLHFQIGTLIRPDVVLTQGNGYVSSSGWNDTGGVLPIPASRLHVLWVTRNGGRRRTAVQRIHVHERTFGDRNDFAWDVAILFLKSSYPDSVACLDLHGTLPPMKTGDKGLLDSWKGDYYSGDRFLFRSPFLSIQDCKSMLPNGRPRQFTPDRFCTGRLNASLWDGAGFFTEHEGSWFLRGCKAFFWDDENQDLFSMVNLEEPSILAWIQEVLEED